MQKARGKFNKTPNREKGVGHRPDARDNTHTNREREKGVGCSDTNNKRKLPAWYTRNKIVYA